VYKRLFSNQYPFSFTKRYYTFSIAFVLGFEERKNKIRIDKEVLFVLKIGSKGDKGILFREHGIK